MGSWRGLGVRCFEGSDWHRPIDRDRFAKRFDALDFVHGLGREVGLAATRARPHGDGLDDKQGRTLTEATRDMLQLNGGAPAVGAMALNGGRQ